MPIYAESLTSTCLSGDRGSMNGALAVLTGAAFFTLIIEAAGTPDTLPAIVWGALFAFFTIVLYGWGDHQDPQRRRQLAIAYLALQLPLAFKKFWADPGVG